MEDKWSFLYPWREALQECKALHDSLEVVESREFRASHLPIHATIQCWASLPQGYEQLAGRCSIPVPFPADAATRVNNRNKLQRIREAMELFNVLAAVSRPLFLELLAEFVVVADNFDDLFTPDFIFVYPVWECYLVGTLDSEDIVAERAWGDLFGCAQDPMKYSMEFCVAMEKLEEMRQEVNEALRNFVGGEAVVEWLDPNNVIEWISEHVAIPTKGIQVVPRSNEAVSRVDSFSHELGTVFKATAPSVVQLCAVADKENMMKRWEELPPDPTPQIVETMAPILSEPGGLQLAIALSRMNLTALRLNLDGIEDPLLTKSGFLLNALVCGRTFHESLEGEQSVSLPRCPGEIADLQVVFAGDSIAGPAGIFSALVESSSIKQLTLNMGVLSDQIGWLNPVRWGWLAYTLWGSASNSGVHSARLTNIHLSSAVVSSVAAALTNCYPPSPLEQTTSEVSVYGFINVPKGTKLRATPLGGSDNDIIVVSSDCRYRAHYGSAEMGNKTEVVAPGYGVCTLEVGNDGDMFVPDDVKPYCKVTRSSGLRSLTLEFFEVENPSLLPSLLSLIGSNLRSLSMGMFWTNRRRGILLDDVAACFPQLEELTLAGFDTALSSGEDVQNWGLKKLSIESFQDVVGLPELLRDPTYRMARELMELEIVVPRSNQISALYADALMSHNGDRLAMMKEKLPRECKAALISVVDGQSCGSDCAQDVDPVRRLSDTVMGFIFAFAATPQHRVVRIISSSS